VQISKDSWRPKLTHWGQEINAVSLRRREETIMWPAKMTPFNIPFTHLYPQDCNLMLTAFKVLREVRVMRSNRQCTQLEGLTLVGQLLLRTRNCSTNEVVSYPRTDCCKVRIAKWEFQCKAKSEVQWMIWRVS
jgi:hypothetical protein